MDHISLYYDNTNIRATSLKVKCSVENTALN